MTITFYLIFTACLLFFNIIALYGYFLFYQSRLNEHIYNEHVVPTLKYAYLIQAISLLIGYGALFCFSEDKTWFYEIKFLYFLGLVLLFIISGLLNKLKGGTVLSSLLELAGILGFVFILPKDSLPFKTSLPPEAVQALTGLGWFICYKFFCILADRFEGIVVIQSLHMGFAVLPILFFLSYSPVSLLQVIGVLFPIMLMLTPFYCVLHYKLPIQNPVRNVFCLLLTGFAFFALPTKNWGMSFLLIGYIIFELVVVLFRFFSNLLKRQKEPLFFFENLMNRTPYKATVIRVVLRYNLLTDITIFILIISDLQFQMILLTVLLFLKMYLNIMISDNKTGIIDLVKGAKETAQTGITETVSAVSFLKGTYEKKKEEKKGKQNDEQS